MGVANRPLLCFPDRSLHRIIAAVEVIWVGEVTVIGHIEMTCASPHKRTDDGFWEEEAIIITCFDSCDLNVRGDSNNADAVCSGGDRPGSVSAVPVVVIPGIGIWIRNAADA